MAKFAWGSSQYDTLADLFRRGSKHPLCVAIEKLEAEGFVFDYDLNHPMFVALECGKLGEMFTVWRSNAKDLWFALGMAEDMLFTHGLSIESDGEELDTYHPIRQSLVAMTAVEFGLAVEDDFKDFDS